ncbi:MAG: hypothetical protein NAG76_14080 [Candidatus Pristimantibacillus lignocellulolyticus]|uniref:Uncharacterized protein n=1 Tax=Candidatus Pristimantibacillus lignocellulolyticus TaxID=2994561 RepID=A0A9J6ZAU9_9BACL|nr:MAG: hypothetical protein NAG76_14080 [Candidatus Pristimantibacillus lignocellulolyticus]
MHTNPKVRLGGKYLWTIVVLLIMGSWGGNVWYYHSMQLEKPIFLKHYMILNGNENDWIQLTYLENKMKGKKVTGIQLEELPMLRFQIDPNPISYRHQVLGKAYGEWNVEEGQQMEKVPVTIKEATVYYSEGLSEKVPIGEINVFWDQRENILETSSSSASSDGTGQYSVTVKQPVTLVKVDYSFKDRLSTMFELTMEGLEKSIPQLPLRLTTGDPLTFKYKWSMTDNIPAAFEVYKTYILLSLETEDGRMIYDRIPTNFNLYLNEKQIKRLVRSGGELY